MCSSHITVLSTHPHPPHPVSVLILREVTQLSKLSSMCKRGHAAFKAGHNQFVNFVVLTTVAKWVLCECFMVITLLLSSSTVSSVLPFSPTQGGTSCLSVVSRIP